MATFHVVDDPGDVRSPALIVSFGDWVDAGGVGTTAARRIAEGGNVVATFDTDSLYDYRSHRPVLDIVDGTPQALAWPHMVLTRRSLAERDLFVLSGAEPDYRWKGFAGDVLELARRIGITEHVSLGAIPTAVPHTAPTVVMMTASRQELLRGAPPIEGLLRVPAAAVSVIERTLAEEGIPAVGFWAQVPHYAAAHAAGSIALIRRVEDHLGVTIGAGSLEQDAAAQSAAFQQIFEENPEAKAYLERLQGLAADTEAAAMENIAEEVERFLRNQRGGAGGSTPFSP
jgi:hypothetical protein